MSHFVGDLENTVALNVWSLPLILALNALLKKFS